MTFTLKNVPNCNKNSTVSHEVIDIIKKKYNIIGIIDLVEYINPDELALELMKYKSYSFSPDEILVVLHHDTDYYESLSSLGHLMYNFLKLCADFDIALNYILFLTNHYGIESEIRNNEESICNSSGLKIVYTSQWYDFPEFKDIRNLDQDYSKNNLDFLYSCLNGVAREHRLFLLSLLKEKNLLNKGMISFHFKN
jgi:hypothetical protein